MPRLRMQAHRPARPCVQLRTSLILTFTESLEATFSNLTVTDASGTEVSQGKAQVNENTMRISLKPLNAGIYKVNWRAVSTDTHKIEERG